MKRASSLFLFAVAQLCAQGLQPEYTASSIVHAASGMAGTLAPNTIASIYGTNLAAGTRALRASDISALHMPSTLPGTGTFVLVGGNFVPIYYASPTQVNFLIPADLTPGRVRISVIVNGISGRAAEVLISSAAPGLFLAAAATPAATDVAGRLLSAENPASAGQWIILYATGLGVCSPPTATGDLARTATPLADPLRVWLGSVAVVPAYAGLAPGYAGLYQINVLVPAEAPSTAEIRIETGGAVSPAGIYLPMRKPN